MAARFSLVRAAAWSLTWAVGAAIGVALGAYLTVTDAVAATGGASLERTEMVVLPLMAGVGVFVVSLLGRFAVAGVSALLRSRQGDSADPDN